MHNVSQEYVASMHSSMREQGYIEVLIGGYYDTYHDPSGEWVNVKMTITNEDVKDSTFSSKMSDITETLPQVDFTVILDNSDHRYDLENPDTLTANFKKDLQVYFRYGYATPGASSIEWLPYNIVFIDSFDVSGDLCTLKCVDVFRTEAFNRIVDYKMPASHDITDVVDEIRVLGGYVTKHTSEDDGFFVSYEISGIPYNYTSGDVDGLPLTVLDSMPLRELIQIIANVANCRIFFKAFSPGNLTVDFITVVFEADEEQHTAYYEMDENTILTEPLVTEDKRIKQIKVAYTSYGKSDEYENIGRYSFDVKTGHTVGKFDIGDVTISENVQLSNITWNPTGSGLERLYLNTSTTAHSFTVYVLDDRYEGSPPIPFPTTLSFDVAVKKRKRVKREVTLFYGGEGEDITWDNPMVNTRDNALDIAAWIVKKRNTGRKTYRLETRGEPELELGDPILQPNRYNDNLITSALEMSFRFNGSFSSSIVTREEFSDYSVFPTVVDNELEDSTVLQTVRQIADDAKFEVTNLSEHFTWNETDGAWAGPGNFTTPGGVRGKYAIFSDSATTNNIVRCEHSGPNGKSVELRARNDGYVGVFNSIYNNWMIYAIPGDSKLHSDRTWEINNLILSNIYGSSAAANVVVDTTSKQLYRSTASSRRYKHDIKPIDDSKALALLQIPVHEFKFNEDYIRPEDEQAGKDVIGLIAEEVDEALPIAAQHSDGQVENWNERILLPALLRLVQIQNERINDLEKRIEVIENGYRL